MTQTVSPRSRQDGHRRPGTYLDQHDEEYQRAVAQTRSTYRHGYDTIRVEHARNSDLIRESVLAHFDSCVGLKTTVGWH
jgi:hypothetical protein